MNRVIFNIKPELRKIDYVLKNTVWSNYKENIILDEISSQLSTNISGIIEKYYVTKSDLKVIHEYLDELRDDIAGDNTKGMEIDKAVSKFDNTLLHNIIFSSNDSEKIQKEFPHAISLIKQQTNNTYVSEKRKRIIPTLSLIISIISAIIAIISMLLHFNAQ